MLHAGALCTSMSGNLCLHFYCYAKKQQLAEKAEKALAVSIKETKGAN
jgi:hypothetical protein